MEQAMEARLDFRKSGPEAAKALDGLERRIARCSLERVLVNLVRLRASQINRCRAFTERHRADLRALGESNARLAAVATWRESASFTDRERAALEWTEAVTLVAQTQVPDAVWERVKPHFTPEEVVDLTLLVATINAWNRFAVSFRAVPA
jgi:AhpD family alkylhydroperoxidase